MSTILNLRAVMALLFLFAIAAPMLAACDDKGPMERAGERIDEGVKDTKRAIEDATD
jgi:predicted small lipoprotein YifL